MKTIAAIEADLEKTPLGTRSRLADELRGIPVLRRTVERLRRVRSIEQIIVLCPEAQKPACADILSGTDAIVRPYQAPPPSWGPLVRTARKWSLSGWRGGIGGSTYFDEFVDARLLSGLLKTTPADAMIVAPPAAPVFDPDLAEKLIHQLQETRNETGLAFTQAPPGLTGIVMDAALIHELAEKEVPIGWVFGYKPDAPAKDVIFQPCCLEAPAAVRHAAGRLCADTDRAWQTLADLLDRHEDPDAETAARFLTERENNTTDPWPAEIELELTTEDPYPDTRLRPRGHGLNPRGPIDLATVESVAAVLAEYDDALLVLGGFGDPLRHPEFTRILATLRAARPDGAAPFGLAVRTTAVDLTDEAMHALVEYGVDILEVLLDAWTPELYARLHTPNATVAQRVAPSPPAVVPRVHTPNATAAPASPPVARASAPGTAPASADLARVCANLDRLGAIRGDRRSVRPILLPHFTKARDNVHELDAFHDGWIRKIGAVVIEGYSYRAGQCDDRAVIPMAPSPRIACRRLRSRCVVLANGQVTLCDQDFNGHHPVGTLHDDAPTLDDTGASLHTAPATSANTGSDTGSTPAPGGCALLAIWRSAAFEHIRTAHRNGQFDVTPRCAACNEWHRP